MIPDLNDISNDLQGKVVLLRSDFNEPIVGGKLVDDFKIKRGLQTLEALQKAGAKVIIISHHSNQKQSLMPVYEYLKERFEISFVKDIYATDEIEKGLERGVVMCENLRFWEGEKENDKAFAGHLASLAEVYVNDAFSASHREHASIVSLPKLLPSYMGLLFKEEVLTLSAFFKPESPSLLILGGAKAKNKLEFLPELLSKFDEVFIGGALANNFFKAQGLGVGDSLVDDSVSVTPFVENPKVILPVDVALRSKDGSVKHKGVSEVEEGDVISDIGEKSIETLVSKIKKAKSLLWGGPLGMYLEKDFEKGTRDALEAFGGGEGNYVVGGGDTSAFIFNNNLEDTISFISTGGGALLTFIAQETLPGIEALKK